MSQNDWENRASRIRTRIIRLLLILAGGLTLSYLALLLAAWATTNPENLWAQFIVYAAIVLFIFVTVAHYFKIWRIISNAFRDDSSE